MGEYGQKYDDLNRDLERSLEPVGENAEKLTNRVGDDVKKVVDTVNVDWYMLASKKAKQAPKTSKSGFYAFAVIGGLSVFAAGAVAIAACGRKKQQISDNEEALL